MRRIVRLSYLRKGVHGSIARLEVSAPEFLLAFDCCDRGWCRAKQLGCPHARRAD
jgi:hypothetical protein